MHDGSLATLRDVVEFYNNGTVPSLTRPNGPPFRLIGPERLTERDIDALVAFLKTLDGEGYQDQSPKHFPR
jgi:cytochrome c peroxidase